MRCAPSIYVVKKIIELGGLIKAFDPKAMNNAKNNYFSNLDGISYCEDKYDVLENSDALILVTEWPEFRSPDFQQIHNKLLAPIIFDGKNQYDKTTLKKIGFEYYQIGTKSI